MFIDNIKEKSYRFVEFNDGDTVFLYIRNNEIVKTITLNISIDNICKDFFVHDIPTEADVENAINTIEDNLMLSKELINDNQQLYISRRFFSDIISTDVIDYSRQEIEEIFTRYALISMGRSPVYDDINMSKAKYAALLLLREIMHHLNFKSVKLV